MAGTEYYVVWDIEIWAESPREAAQKARMIQHNPDNLAGVFKVTDESGSTHQIDLDEPTDWDPADQILPTQPAEFYDVVTRHTDGSTSKMEYLTLLDTLTVVGTLDRLLIIDCVIKPHTD